MPLARHRLDLIALPQQLDHVPPLAPLQAVVAGRGEWVSGGCAGVRLEASDELRFYANELGGFRVRCPHCREPLARAFGKAMETWRQGGPRSVECRACGTVHALEDVDMFPEGGFGRCAVIVADVASPDLLDEARADLESVMGPLRVVRRRVV